MSDTPAYSQLSYYFSSLSFRPAKVRTEVFWGGTVLLLSMLAFGSSAFAQATFNSATLAFYDHVVNVPSGVKKAWLTNTQAAPITITSIAIGGGNAPGDYVLDTGGTCPLSPSTLGAGDKCNIPVIFTPSALGSRTATLTVTDDATNNPQTVALTGTGVEPVDLTPSPLKFGNQPQGTTGAAKTATLKNYQTATLTNISISASGDYSNPRYGFPYTRFPSERLQPLGHPSGHVERNIAMAPGVTTHAADDPRGNDGTTSA